MVESKISQFIETMNISNANKNIKIKDFREHNISVIDTATIIRS